ncbi:hypothetical protein GCM10009641_45900 [Mycobacterium cookii]|uniref:DUF1707 domain-containing protein n=1 Tax=Nocardioides furvisabuli TaxID=375542 RepID=A0ABP5JFR0_9ACTN|nr:DUF1707 domain-containing protein [Nocardioides furvisabuli]
MSRSGSAAPGGGPGDEALRRWYAARERVEQQRDARLASDSERDQVCTMLNQAFGEGRLTPTELDERTARALASRTHGDLEDVLAGLHGMAGSALWNTPAPRGVLPRLVFWVVGLLTAPFVLLGGGLLLFGEGFGERIGGIIVLTLFLPGLVALYRWAHPRL